MTLKRVTVAGFTKIESTVRYLGIKVEALAIAEQVDARNTRGRAETFCSASNRQFVRARKSPITEQVYSSPPKTVEETKL